MGLLRAPGAHAVRGLLEVALVRIIPGFGDIILVYVGKDDGSETWEATVKCYFKKSADGMGSWGAEQTYGVESDDLRCVSLGRTVGDAGGRVMPVWFNDDLVDITVNDGNDVEIAAVDGVTTRRYSLTTMGVG